MRPNNVLYEAASHDSIDVTKLLIECGTELEALETNWNNTPLDHAMYGNQQRMIEFLGGFTRDAPSNLDRKSRAVA